MDAGRPVARLAFALKKANCQAVRSILAYGMNTHGLRIARRGRSLLYPSCNLTLLVPFEHPFWMVKVPKPASILKIACRDLVFRNSVK